MARAGAGKKPFGICTYSCVGGRKGLEYGGLGRSRAGAHARRRKGSPSPVTIISISLYLATRDAGSLPLGILKAIERLWLEELRAGPIQVSRLAVR